MKEITLTAGPAWLLHAGNGLNCMLAGTKSKRSWFSGISHVVQAKKRRRTSSFRGVTRAGGKWKAAIRANNVKKDLGVFEDELDAAR